MLGRRHVTFFGDSHLAATSSSGIRKLDTRLRDLGWEVENLAVGGLTTRSALERLPEVATTGPSVFSFGTNDAAPWKQVPLDEFERNYKQLLARCSGKIVVLGPTPVIEQDAPSRTNTLQRQYSVVAAAVAAYVHGTFIDLIDLLGTRDDVLLDDGLHLNDVAYEAIAEVVVSALDAPSAEGFGR